MLRELRSDLDDKNLAEKGFTLVELLVVIVILGILAAVVVFAVGGITDRGTGSACATEMRTFLTAVEAHRGLPSNPTGALPDGNGAAAGNGTAAEVAIVLEGEDLLSNSTLGYNGAGAEQWSYDSGSGDATPGASCS